MAERSGVFGERLRRHREVAGYSQEELAERAGLTANAIGALERGERKRPYPLTLRRLADALGLSEVERTDLVAAASRTPGAGAPAPALTNRSRTGICLPGALTPLIGRDREAEVVLRLFARPEVRLLTLTGTGGVGKTRLALHVASELRDGFPDGVVWVSLAPLSDSRLVAPTIARTLGLSTARYKDSNEALRAFLRVRQMLLVLDNFEHLLTAAAGVADLLVACPGLTVLATSRAPLGVQGEQEYAVPPLELPRTDRAWEKHDLEAVPSVQLFVRRAHAASPAFQLTRDNATDVIAICRHLDGLPLALELAAARVKLLGPAELLARLDRALPVLTGSMMDLPERQRTMESAIGWSYDLLGPSEQALFRSLSIFAGGWTLEAAEAVGSHGAVRAEDVLELLGRLVGHSLVVAGTGRDGATRYRLLEPVRQCARRLLEKHEEAELVAERHLEYYLQHADRVQPELFGPRMVERLERLEAEYNNLRTAVAWALANGRAEVAARLVHALARFFWQRGHREVLRWMEKALASTDLKSPGARARATYVAELMRYRLGSAEGIAAACQEAAAVLRAEGETAAAVDALMLGGMAALRTADADQAAQLLEEGRDLAESAGDEQGIALALAFLGTIPLRSGDYATAEAYCERGLKLARRSGNALSVYPPLYNLALAAQGKGEYSRARAYYAELVGVGMHLGDKPLVAFAITGLAECSAAQGYSEWAARLYGGADAVFASVGVEFHPMRVSPDFHEHYVELARERLGARAFEAARTEGRAMTPEEAVEAALRDVDGGGSSVAGQRQAA